MLSLSFNGLSASEFPFSLTNCSSLETLDLSHNDLHMKIPGNVLGKFKNLKQLVLAHNWFFGEIPLELGQVCDSLEELDLSGNQLTGYLPLSLTACSSMYSLNLRSNQLSHDFLSNVVSSITSLKYLYVPPSLKIVVSFGCWILVPLRKLTFGHLLEATNGFSSDSLIGSGGFGEVCKAQLKDGSVVAIKKLIQVTGQGDREFMAEMETIGKIKHRNLVPLLGYCKIGEERLLVYEYMKWVSPTEGQP